MTGDPDRGDSRPGDRPATTLSRPGLRRRAGTIAVTLAAVAALLVAGLLLVPAILGYRTYVVTGDSMTGTLDRGSLVYERSVPVSSLRVGDIITYQPPPGAQARRQLVTHRIARISRDRRGERVFVTKGDHNAAADPWTFTLDRPRQARYSFHIPYLGWAYASLSIGWVRALLLAIPALLVGVALLRRAWRTAGDEAAGGERNGPEA
jgi:signal peptidase I